MLGFHLGMKTLLEFSYKLFTESQIDYFIPLFDYRIYADSIIIFCPKQSSDKGNQIINTLIIDACSNLQCHFLKAEILLRGVITYGNLYVQQSKMKDFIYGSGIIKVTEMEKNLSIPIIHIDDSIHITDQYTSSYIKRSRNKPRWSLGHIDYLSYFSIRHKSTLTKSLKDLLNAHRRTINNFPEFKIRLKKRKEWLTRYHNDFCNEHSYSDYIII